MVEEIKDVYYTDEDNCASCGKKCGLPISTAIRFRLAYEVLEIDGDLSSEVKFFCSNTCLKLFVDKTYKDLFEFASNVESVFGFEIDEDFSI